MNVRLGNKKDINKISEFINKFWKKNHILSKDLNLLKWQHQSVLKKKISILILEEIKIKKIIGILGFILN